MSIFGALGRSKTFIEAASEDAKSPFRHALREKLKEISRGYGSTVEEQEHLSNIERLSGDLTAQFSNCLRAGRFRIGIAQKAMNLYLKYLWCVDLIPLPPHCPFDAIIIGRLPNCRDLKWTSIDTIEDYQRLVKAAREKADGETLSEWELKVFNNPRPPKILDQGKQLKTSEIHETKNYRRPSVNPTLQNLKRELADKYIEDSQQREIFLTKATQYKMWANYIAGLILTNRGYREFHITDIRQVLRSLLGDLYDGPGAKEAGLLPQDMAYTANWHSGYPCLQRVDGKRGYYTFHGFPKERQP